MSYLSNAYPAVGPYSSLGPTYGPAIPMGAGSSVMSSPMLGGIANLPGSSGGVLARGLTPLSSPITAAELPYASSAINGLASQVPRGVGMEAFNAASALGEAGGGAGMGARLAGGLGTLGEGASGIGTLGVGGTARALLSPYSAAGLLGSAVIDRTNIGGQNSNLEQGLQGFALGAGGGAAIGSVVPGLGTAIGALAGGLTGGTIAILGNMFGGHKKKEKDPMVDGEHILANAMTAGGLDDATMAHILDTYEVNLKLAEQYEDKDQKKQAQAQALNTAGALVLQAMQNGGGLGLGGGPSPADLLALQAQSQQIFQPIAQDIRDNGQLYAQAMQDIIPQLPPSFRASAQMTAARELNSGNKLADAYMAQAAITPVMQKVTQYQQDYNSYAAQQFQQALAAQQAGGAGGGGTDVAAILQQMG